MSVQPVRREGDLVCRRQSRLLSQVGDRRVYFVHSYRATPSPENDDWVLATTEYGSSFVSAVQKGEISATQFHPEKSGTAGLDIIESFLEAPDDSRPAYTNGESCLEPGYPSPAGVLVDRHNHLTCIAYTLVLRLG